ncbi:MAG: UDP-3-O-acyl-N-acetylglucosamine deacetylase [Desulfovermiculus sp.]|nr:UDP-3-O-acyl-N-acetylglucosamine deacetylase [Desulfovermiculus sp.]
MQERTIEHPITCSGVGLHSGQKVDLAFYPLPASSGVIWSLLGDKGGSFLELSPEKVVDTSLCTTLGSSGGRVGTVEHVMAAIRGMGIDNILVEIAGPEVPIMDGSAASFVYLLRRAGIKDQRESKKVYVVTKAARLEEEGKWITVRPGNEFRVRYRIKFPHPMVGCQEMSFAASTHDFTHELARARTFGFLNDVQALQSQGQALGGSLENALVFDQTGVINADGFRYPDEPVRHKVLDLIGDIGLLPYPIIGSFDVYCSGHALNTAFAQLLYRHKENYLQLIELDEMKNVFPPRVVSPAVAWATPA